jgi:hypothetical protein
MISIGDVLNYDSSVDSNDREAARLSVVLKNRLAAEGRGLIGVRSKSYMSRSSVSGHSLGIASVLVKAFFPALENDRKKAGTFYGSCATLCWQGEQIDSDRKIREFLARLPQFQVRVDGYEVQTVPGSDETWSMVVVIGTIKLQDSVKRFHSSLYVEARKDEGVAFIQHQAFQCFLTVRFSIARIVMTPRMLRQLPRHCYRRSLGDKT